MSDIVKCANISDRETVLKVKISNNELNIKELSSLKDYKSCPLCKQDLDYNKAKPLIEKKKDEIELLKFQLSEVLLEAKSYKEETIIIIEDNMSQLKDYFESLRLNFYDKKSEHNNIVEAIKNKAFNASLEKVSALNSFYKEKIDAILATLSTELVALESSRKTLALELEILCGKEGAIEKEFMYAQSSVDSLEDEVKSLKKEVDTLKSKLSKLEVDKTTLLDRKETLDFWVEGFGNKGIKSFILETSFPYLNERANFYSSFLTGGSVLITISPTVTAKTTGNVKEKIVITAENSYGANVYSGQSDGERRRIDLCILLALKDLIALRAKRSFSLMVLDEIGDSLDTSGLERMVSVFREISKDKAIYVISHNEQLKQFFDQTLLIVKSGGESVLQ
jgi:DNA repair exonuclease SbcCD ATPase subunit